MLVLLSIKLKMIWICLMGPNSLKCTKILSMSPFYLFYLVFLYRVKTHLWMIIMESIIVMV